MPIIVPTLDPARTALARAAPDTRLGVRTTPEDYGAGLGQGIQSLAGDAARVYFDIRKSANQVRVLEADTQDATEDDAARRALSQAKGKDAAAAFEKIAADRQKRQAEIMAGLSNPDQREAFQARAMARSAAFEDAGNRHIIAEAEAYDRQTMGARASLAEQRLQGAGTNATEIDAQLAAFDADHKAYAERMGMPPEQVQVERQALVDRGILGNIQAQVDAQNDLGAGEVLDRYKDALSPAARADAIKLLDAASTTGTAQRIVGQYVIRGGLDLAGAQRLLLGEIPSEARDVRDEIARLQDSTDPADISRRENLQKYLDQTDRGPAKAPEWVTKAMENPKIRDQVRARAVDAISLRERAKEQQQDQLFQSLYRAAKDDPRGLDALPLSQLQALEPQRRQQLEAWGHRQARGETLPWMQSKKVRYQIEAALRDPGQRESILRRGPAQFLGTMNEDDQNAIGALFADANRGAGSDAAMQAALATKDDLIKEALVSMGKPSDPITKDRGGKETLNPDAIRFRDAVETRARALTKPGEKPTVEVWRQAVKDEQAAWVKQVVIPRWYGSEKTIASKAPAFARTVGRRDQIPADELAKIMDAARESGTTLTDQQAVDIYNQRVMQEPARAE